MLTIDIPALRALREADEVTGTWLLFPEWAMKARDDGAVAGVRREWTDERGETSMAVCFTYGYGGDKRAAYIVAACNALPGLLDEVGGHGRAGDGAGSAGGEAVNDEQRHQLKLLRESLRQTKRQVGAIPSLYEARHLLDAVVELIQILETSRD